MVTSVSRSNTPPARVKTAWRLAALFPLSIGPSAVACECVYMSPTQHTEWAETILVAEVAIVARTQITVLPIEILKGHVSQPLLFPIGPPSNCDYFSIPENVRVGERHLFYLRHHDDKLVPSICSGSGPMEKKQAELEELRKQIKHDIAEPRR